MKKTAIITEATQATALQLEKHKAFVAACHTYKPSKDLSDAESDAHFSIRGFLRETVQDSGLTLKDATPDDLKLFVATVVVAVKAGTVGTTRMSISRNLEVCAWALKHELKVIADADQIGGGRAIEVFIITDFFAGDSKKPTEEPIEKPAKAAKSQKVVLPAKTEKAPAFTKKEVPATKKPTVTKKDIPAGFIERPDLMPQLNFDPFTPVSQLIETFEAWNMGGRFALLYKGKASSNFIDAGKWKGRERFKVLDSNDLQLSICFIDEIAKWYKVVEKQ